VGLGDHDVLRGYRHGIPQSKFGDAAED